MLQSKLIGETKKEWPSEASIKSHGILIKGGYIKQMASGIYTLLPLAKKVTQKIENITKTLDIYLLNMVTNLMLKSKI